MELDREKERRIWERVRAGQEMRPLKAEGLDRLEALARENAAALQKLSRKVPGKDGEKLRRLGQEQNRLAWAVRGLGYLRGEPGHNHSPAPAAKESATRILSQSLTRAMEFRQECADRASDPDYGPIFAALARQSAEQAAAMAEVLGEMYEPDLRKM